MIHGNLFMGAFLRIGNRVQDDKAEPKKQDESKGVEMEGDFEGSLHDLQADPNADDQEQEEGQDERMDQVCPACSACKPGRRVCVVRHCNEVLCK